MNTEKIILIRNLLRLNIGQMAARLGISREYLTRLENGKDVITDKVSQKFKKILESKEFRLIKAEIENLDKNISLLSKEDFHALGDEAQVEYINYFARMFSGNDWINIVKGSEEELMDYYGERYYKEDNQYDCEFEDIDSNTPIEDLFDYATDVNFEWTDLHNRLFLEKIFKIQRNFGISNKEPSSIEDIIETCQESEDVKEFRGTVDEAIEYFRQNYNDCEFHKANVGESWFCSCYELVIEYTNEVERIVISENF